MVYKHHESEKFRASVFLFAGYTFCSPLCILILNWILSWSFGNVFRFIPASILFMAGFYLISKSYDVMLRKEFLK
jgi:hypothetical protein